PSPCRAAAFARAGGGGSALYPVRPGAAGVAPEAGAMLAAVARRTGQRLLKFDRKLGARLVAGTDEAGRGPLAGPLVVAGVLLDRDCLREHRARPFTYLNDSKQLTPAQREELFGAIDACAEQVVVRVIPPVEIH